MKNAPTVTLESLTEGKRKITYGVVKPGDPDPCEGIIFIRGGDVSEGKINIPGLRTIRKDVSDQYKRTLLRGGELLVSLVGNPGEVASAPKKLAGANIARQVGLIDLTDDVCHKFVEWFLRSPQGQAEMGLYVTGAVQKVINLADLKRVRIPLPEIATQRKIASILSAYDDLIENNTRRIEILEEMARRFYEEWFVHFRFPGHEEVRFKESELGDIPEGWEVYPIKDLCLKINSGSTPPKKKTEFWESGTVCWYKTKELWDGFLFQSEERVTEKSVEKKKARIFEPGTILMAIYGSPTVGRLGVVTERCSSNQAALGMVPDQGAVSFWVFYFNLWALREEFNSLAQGAAQQNISKEKVAKSLMLVPEPSLQKRFEAAVGAMKEQTKLLQRKNTNLRAQRDLLLPKLVSGEIDVSDIPMPNDKEVEVA